ncbi:hypothetical protein SISSUDRAFT_969696, partial [Sistotremastrum suecicum HHB10207 ss-3]
YLDDLFCFGETIELHDKSVFTVFRILKRNELYLSLPKINLLPPSYYALGSVLDRKGIKLDPHKVDNILKWKTPSNRQLLMEFIGAVGY